MKSVDIVLVSNTTPIPPNIRPDPKKTKRKSCIGPGKPIICKEKKRKEKKKKRKGEQKRKEGKKKKKTKPKK